MTLIWSVLVQTGSARLGDVMNAKKKKIGCMLIVKHFLRSDEKVKLVTSLGLL